MDNEEVIELKQRRAERLTELFEQQGLYLWHISTILFLFCADLHYRLIATRMHAHTPSDLAILL